MTAFWWTVAIVTGGTLYLFFGSLHWSLGMRFGWYESDPEGPALMNDPLLIASVLWPVNFPFRIAMLGAFGFLLVLDLGHSRIQKMTDWLVDWPARRKRQKDLPPARVVDR